MTVAIPSLSGHAVIWYDRTHQCNLDIVYGRNPLFIGSCSDINVLTAWPGRGKSGPVAIPSLSGHAVIYVNIAKLSCGYIQGRNPLFIGSCSDIKMKTYYYVQTEESPSQSPLYRVMQ